MKLFDSHAHYNDSRFAGEYPGGAARAIADAFSVGICGFLNCGTNPETSRESILLASQYENVYAAVGLHPEDASELSTEQLKGAVAEIEALLSSPKVVALGEIGLDYHWEIDHAMQKELFDAQLSIAEAKKLPVVVHDRDAHGDTLDIIRSHPNAVGVMHGYSGSAETLKEYMRLGWYCAFGGPVTYKNAEKVRDACRAAEADRMLIETDCPYLPPVPHRGEINYSGYMSLTLDAMARARDEAPEALAEHTVKNTERLLAISL